MLEEKRRDLERSKEEKKKLEEDKSKELKRHYLKMEITTKSLFLSPLIMTTTLASTLSVPLNILSIDQISRVFDPRKFEVIKDTIVPLGSFYFNSAKKGIIKKTHNTRRLEEDVTMNSLEQTMV